MASAEPPLPQDKGSASSPRASSSRAHTAPASAKKKAGAAAVVVQAAGCKKSGSAAGGAPPSAKKQKGGDPAAPGSKKSGPPGAPASAKKQKQKPQSTEELRTRKHARLRWRAVSEVVCTGKLHATLLEQLNASFKRGVFTAEHVSPSTGDSGQAQKALEKRIASLNSKLQAAKSDLSSLKASQSHTQNSMVAGTTVVINDDGRIVFGSRAFTVEWIGVRAGDIAFWQSHQKAVALLLSPLIDGHLLTRSEAALSCCTHLQALSKMSEAPENPSVALLVSAFRELRTLRSPQLGLWAALGDFGNLPFTFVVDRVSLTSVKPGLWGEVVLSSGQKFRNPKPEASWLRVVRKAQENDRIFDHLSAIPIREDLNAISWAGIKRVSRSSEGAIGVFFLQWQNNNCVVIKKMDDVAATVIGSRLASHVGCLCPAVHLLVSGTGEYEELMESLHNYDERASAQSRDRHPKLGSSFAVDLGKSPVIAVMQYVQGTDLIGLGRQQPIHSRKATCETWFGPAPSVTGNVDERGKKSLQSLGRLIALDSIIFNYDRVPVTYDNAGNPGNVLFDTRSGCIQAIDTATGDVGDFDEELLSQHKVALEEQIAAGQAVLEGTISACETRFDVFRSWLASGYPCQMNSLPPSGYDISQDGTKELIRGFLSIGATLQDALDRNLLSEWTEQVKGQLKDVEPNAKEWGVPFINCKVINDVMRTYVKATSSASAETAAAAAAAQDQRPGSSTLPPLPTQRAPSSTSFGRVPSVARRGSSLQIDGRVVHSIKTTSFHSKPRPLPDAFDFGQFMKDIDSVGLFAQLKRQCVDLGASEVQLGSVMSVHDAKNLVTTLNGNTVSRDEVSGKAVLEIESVGDEVSVPQTDVPRTRGSRKSVLEIAATFAGRGPVLPKSHSVPFPRDQADRSSYGFLVMKKMCAELGATRHQLTGLLNKWDALRLVTHLNHTKSTVTKVGESKPKNSSPRPSEPAAVRRTHSSPSPTSVTLTSVPEDGSSSNIVRGRPGRVTAVPPPAGKGHSDLKGVTDSEVLAVMASLQHLDIEGTSPARLRQLLASAGYTGIGERRIKKIKQSIQPAGPGLMGGRMASV